MPAQEFRPGPTVHGSFESFQAVDLSFCLTLLQRSVIAFLTASISLRKMRANRCIA
jgi:hypothetical protein